MKSITHALALFSAASLFFSSRAHADIPAPFSAFDKPLAHEPESARAPGYFNGIGTGGRMWEAQTSTSFDTNRVFTERIDLAVAVPIKFISPLVTGVVRAGFGGNADTTTGFYGIQGPIFSFGIRDRSKDANFWVEFGVRLLPNYSSPNDTSPAAQQAALRSTFSSGIADDAAWLPLADFGTQIYASFQSRTSAWSPGNGTSVYFGATYGGRASLAPLDVKTWLGPQTGFIGNVYLDVFFGIPVLWNKAANTQVGVHGELSLSSIWPGSDPFPIVGNAFVGWSPKSWFEMRVFAGFSGSANNPNDNQYGARLAFFVP